MDWYKLLGFVGILRESLNIFFRNGKLMASLTIPTLFIYSLLLLSNIFFTKPLITDLIVKETFLFVMSPGSAEFANLLFGIKEDIRIIVGVESTFVFAKAIISLFFATATIFATAITYCGKNSSLKELLTRVVRSWIRPLVTGFYITLFNVAYTFLVLAILIPLVVITGLPVTSNAAFITLVIPAMVFYLYLAVVWTLGLVVSVIEERCYGIEAFGKAGRLVKGKKLHGFALNLLFMLPSLVVVQGLIRIIKIKQSLPTQIIMGLLVINSLFLVNMFNMMAYTVLYYQCKKIHGEEIELQGSIEYSKIPSTPPVISEDMP